MALEKSSGVFQFLEAFVDGAGEIGDLDLAVGPGAIDTSNPAALNGVKLGIFGHFLAVVASL